MRSCVVSTSKSGNLIAIFKMLSYDRQLELKRDTVVEAYSNYSSEFSGNLRQLLAGAELSC